MSEPDVIPDGMFEVVVPGNPEPQRRPRAVSVSGGRTRVYRSPQDDRYRARIFAAWVKAGRPTIDHRGALAVSVRAVWERPKSHWTGGGGLSSVGRRHPIPTTRADLDNVLKAALDGLVECGAIQDDRYVSYIDAAKRWYSDQSDEGPHLRIVVAAINGDELLRSRGV